MSEYCVPYWKVRLLRILFWIWSFAALSVSVWFYVYTFDMTQREIWSNYWWTIFPGILWTIIFHWLSKQTGIR